MAHGTVLSFSPEMMSRGPRSGFTVLTLTSVHGFTVAAWNSGAPDAGTANDSYSSLASASLTALANAYLNCSYVSGIARFQLAGFCSTGDAALRAEIGRGSTPRNGAGSIATDAAA